RNTWDGFSTRPRPRQRPPFGRRTGGEPVPHSIVYVARVFSRRTNWNPIPNRLALARATHPEALDLTISNPTRAALPYPLDELAAVMARAARAPYEPEPLGLPAAREAVAHA